MLVRVGHHRAPRERAVRLVVLQVHLALVREHDGGVEAHGAALGVVDGAHLEAARVAAHEARLAAAVAGGARRHHARLRENRRPSVVPAREGDGVLVVVRQVEVRGEPALDLRVGAHGVDEQLRSHRVVVVEPAAAVDDVALLEHAQARADHGRVREAENLPPVLVRVLLHGLDEPVELLLVHRHLVRGVRGVAELRRAEADDERLGRDLVAKLGGLLAHVLQVRREVLLVRGELIDALEVVVAADDVVLVPEPVEELADHLEALGGAREQLLGLGAVLGLAEIAQGHQEGVGGLVQDLLDVLATLVRVLDVAGVHVQVTEDRQRVVGGVIGLDVQAHGFGELRGGHLQGPARDGRAEGGAVGCGGAAGRGNRAAEGSSRSAFLQGNGSATRGARIPRLGVRGSGGRESDLPCQVPEKVVEMGISTHS